MIKDEEDFDENEVIEGVSSSETQSVIESLKLERIQEENRWEAQKISVQRLTPVRIDQNSREFFQPIESKIDELVKATEEYSKFLFKRLNGTVDEEEGEPQSQLLTEQPSILKGGQLKDYQISSLNWLISLYESGLNGILADEMGLGKTIQTIALIGYLRQFKGIHKYFLIVAPKSTLGNWMREFSVWLPQCRVVKLVAVMEEREKILNEFIKNGNFDICITSFAGVQKCYRELSRFQYKYLIVDEAHQLKSEETINHQLLRSIRTKYKLFLTGTPLQNNPHELWCLLNFLLPQLFDSSEVFDKWFEMQNVSASENISQEDLQKKNLELVNKFHKVLRPFMLRRTKLDVEQSIPPKKEIHLYMNLSSKQVELYKKILLEQPINGLEQRFRLQNKLMQLRKVCLHPYLFPEVEEKGLPPLGDHIIEVSGKMRFLDVFLKILKRDKHQVLIFSQFTSMLDILEDYCNYREYGYCRIDGNTELDERDKQISDFIEPGSNYFIFLLSTRAGGLGINLTSADTVILYDSDYNPQMDLQAMDRAHRIGQKNIVKVYRLVTRNTVEEKIIERQQVKLRWDQLMIQHGVRSSMHTLVSKNELQNMISFGAQQIFAISDEWKEDDVNDILKEGEQRTDELNKKIQEQIEQAKQIELGLKQINIYEFLGQQNKNDIQVLKAKIQENKSIPTEKEEVVFLEDQIQKKEFYDFHLYSDIEKLKELQYKEDLYLLYQRFSKEGKQFKLLNEVIPKPLTNKEKILLKKFYNESFQDINSTQFKLIINACEKYGKDHIDEIANHSGVEQKYLEQYMAALFEKGVNIASISEKIKRISKAEQKKSMLEEQTKLISEFLQKFNYDFFKITFDPKIYKNFKHNLHNTRTDKLILLGLYKHGLGKQKKLREYLLNSHYLDHSDLIFLSLSDAEIQSRVRSLIRILELEQQELNLIKNDSITNKIQKDSMEIHQSSQAMTKSQSSIKIKIQPKKSNKKVEQSEKILLDNELKGQLYESDQKSRKNGRSFVKKTIKQNDNQEKLMRTL